MHYFIWYDFKRWRELLQTQSTELPDLSGHGYSGQILAFNIEFDGDNERDWASAALEAIKVIQDNLTAIPNEQNVLLFELG